MVDQKLENRTPEDSSLSVLTGRWAVSEKFLEHYESLLE